MNYPADAYFIEGVVTETALRSPNDTRERKARARQNAPPAWHLGKRSPMDRMANYAVSVLAASRNA